MGAGQGPSGLPTSPCPADFVFGSASGAKHRSKPRLPGCTLPPSVEGRDSGCLWDRCPEAFAHRNPLLLFLFSGLFLFRLAARKFLVLLLFQEPPRRTRAHISGSPPFEYKFSENLLP